MEQKKPRVFYKNIEYELEFRGETVSKIVSLNGMVSLTVETKNLLSPMQQEEKRNNTRSSHVNWIK